MISSVIISSFSCQRLSTYPEKISEKDSDLQSKKAAEALKKALEDEFPMEQGKLLELFEKLDRKWQYRAMFLVWKSHKEPPINDYGRYEVAKSVLCLLDRACPEAPRTIDLIIEEIDLSLKRAMPPSPPIHGTPCPPLSFRSQEVMDKIGIDSLKQAILEAEVGSPTGDEISIKPSPSPHHFSRITNLHEQAKRYTLPELQEKFSGLIDPGIIQYLRNPWEYLKKRFFPEKDKISDQELNEAAKDALSIYGFSSLNFKVIEHSSAAGWILKGNTSQVSCLRNAAGITGNNRYDHLNRVVMSEKMRTVVEAENLRIGFPRTYLIDTGIPTDDLEKRYLIVQEKLPILSHKENVALFASMPQEEQFLYAEHVCQLILKTGYSDVNFGNMTFFNGKLYIYDEEAMGALVEQGDTAPYFDKTLDECAVIGLQQMINCLGNDLPIFRVAAENALVDLREKWVFSRHERKKFGDFLSLVKDPSTSPHLKWNAFLRLDSLLRRFLASVVATAIGYSSENETLLRIQQQPDILSFIVNGSGVSLLEQLQASFEIQSHREILQAIKGKLIQRESFQKSLPKLKALFDSMTEGRPFFNSLNKKIEWVIADIAKDGNIAEAAKSEVFCSLMLRMHLRNSKCCIWDDLDRSLFDLKRNNCLQTMQWKVHKTFSPYYSSSILNPIPARPAPKEAIGARRMPERDARKKLHVLMVAYECAAYGLKFGGLGEAVYGMAKGLEKRGHKVTILLPKFDKLPATTQSQMKEIETIEQPYLGASKKERIFGMEDGDISIRYLEGDKDYYSMPDSKRIYEDGVLADPEEPWVGLKKRMAHFSNATSEYIAAHPETDVAVFHDWHCAYAIHQISHRYFELWSQGKTPATVFVIHNNSYGCQGIYDGKAAHILPLYGDHRPGMNVMLDALKLADQNVTVSPNFAYEIQQQGLGAGIDPWIRQTAHEGKLTGITNGSNPDLWNPLDNATLRDWVDPVTKQPVPLSFSPNDPDLLEKKKQIKIQLQKALEVYYPNEVQKFRINVRDKDLILYVGRYDSSQKGLDKFCNLLRAAHQKDAAFITMGVGEDVKATEILDSAEREAEILGNAWITRGKEDGFSIKMQLGDKEKEIPGLGPLLRAAAIYCVAPSSFEPCGLVQFEVWLFGCLIIATATGGLADTIVSNPHDPEFNGFLFDRLGNWESQEQGMHAYEVMLQAIDYWRSLTSDQKTHIMQRIMKNAQASSWSSSPSGLTPIQQYERVFDSAIENKKRRGIKPIDLIGTDETFPVARDHYFGEGRQFKLYEGYGAHLVYDEDKVVAVHFQVMAPGAQSVYVVIQKNLEEHFYPMKNCGNGNWNALIPQATEGTIYCYEIVDLQGKAARKADPFAFRSELRPSHGSVVADCQFEWTDGEWIQSRAVSVNKEKPYNIYEVHLGTWRRNSDGSFKNYRKLAHELSDYCKLMHYTHIELLGILEHPSDDSWGYQVSGFFSPTSRHGTPQDFQYFINHMHTQKLGIILDFIPFHFAPDEWGLRAFSGVNLFESLDLYNGEPPGWGTRLFDLQREDVRNFLLSSAHFFLSQYHIDGLRVDAVAHLITFLKSQHRWIPNEEGSHWDLGGIAFLRALNEMVHSEFPGVITHSENSRGLSESKIDTDSIEMDGLGFDRRWNMHWMHKALTILAANPSDRKWQFESLCANFEENWQFRHISSISHDEGSLYCKPQGSISERLAQMRLHKALQTFFPGSGQLSFMGNEFAQEERWNGKGDLQWSLLSDPGHRGVLLATRATHSVYLNYPCLWDTGAIHSNYEQIYMNTEDCVIGYRRKHPAHKQLTIVQNFSNNFFPEYKVYFPMSGSMKDIRKMQIVFNTDCSVFGGSGMLDQLKEATLFTVEKPPSKGFAIPLPAFSAVVLEEEHY